MNLGKLSALENFCMDKMGRAGGARVGSYTKAERSNDLASEFDLAVTAKLAEIVNHMDRQVFTREGAELLRACAKLVVAQQWIDKGRNLSGVNLGAFDTRFLVRHG